ncbi:hypothetical protein ACFQV2_13715 [Actinokineospora soli]|uniref:Tetratricopeptide repeat-containing protein n=1 Tax=Actinokineospora soli TaxID=1048753 RepID=A0ABW2TMG4_9PSEU
MSEVVVPPPRHAVYWGDDRRARGNTVAGVVHGPVVQAGSIAGGVHFHDGARRHVIEALPEPGRASPRWLMEQPSRLLDARGQVVPFTGREAELEHLREWRDQDARLAVRLLHGPGGQGKTRLAAEFGERSRHGWTVAQARLPGGSSSGQALDDGAGLLLVVDYADRWAHTELTRLFADPALRKHDRVRVLLIGRSVRWYAAIRAELAERRAEVDDMPLPPLTDDRHAVFAAARDRYAQPDLYDLPDASGIRPPEDHRDYGLVLTLHMAALVAVDARKRGRRAPTEPHELSGYLLDREYQAWQRLHDAGSHGQDYRTRPAVMARAVFTAALTGAVSHDTGTSALEAVTLPGEDLLIDHRFCYPPVDRGLVLEPLYPDRLAEDFLGLLMPGHAISAYDPDPWATSVPGKLLTTGGVREATAGRAVTFLASAAARWPHLAEKSLYPLIREDPALAVEAGSNALATLADLDGIPIDVLEAVYSALPPGSRLDLDVGAAAITGAYVTRMLDVVDDDEVRAELHIDYSNRLVAAGHRRQSLEHSWRAVEHFRALAENDANHLHNLARAVHNHADGLASVGRLDDALECSQLAVDLREHLAEHDPAHLEDLARSTCSHAMRLAENGQRALALEYSGRAVEQYRALVDSDPAHLTGLARACDSHASCLAEVGRPADALEYSEFAVELHRALAGNGPDRALARAYDHHSWWLAEAKKTEEALHYSHQAVAAFEHLAGINRVAFLPDLAAAVANLANRLAEAGRHAEALTCSWRAVELCEDLVEDDRVAHLPASRWP